MGAAEIRRLHWGCGTWRPKGWINSDIKPAPGVDLVCDILQGLPLETDSIDYAVSICALPEMTYPDLIPVLQELRRVLKPGAVLRLGLADLDKAIAAYQRGDKSHFLIPDDEAKSLGAKFCVYLAWYGYVKLLFTRDFIEEMLLKAGFAKVKHCEFLQTASPWPEITELDNRSKECLFVEATK